MQADPGAVTALLHALAGGRSEALGELMPLVYDELRRLARGRLNREPGEGSLDTTSLVHEAYIKLIDQQRVQWADRAHFYAIASMAMRRVLVDAARARRRDRRGGGAVHVTLHPELHPGATGGLLDILALDGALTRLEAISERARQVVECRYFGGLSIEETAEALGVAPMTVKRDWRTAQAWLARDLGRG